MLQLLRDSARSLSYRWFDRFQAGSNAPPHWSLDPDRLARTVVHWPDKYQWGPSASFLDPIRLGLAQWVKVESRSIPHSYKGVSLFDLVLDGRTHRIAVDYSDYMERIEHDCLRTVSLYFKMQCLRSGYPLDPEQADKVRPGGYVTGDRRLGPSLRSIRETGRNASPEFQVYGRFGFEFAKEVRTAVVDLLRSDPALSYAGGMKKVPYRQSVIDASRSKICIDLPGNGDFCFRLFDYLSVGAFVIAYPHRTILPEPLVPGEHIIYMRHDLSDLIPLCRHYLAHEEERRAIQSKAAAYFDSCCHYRQLGSWYLHECLNMAERYS